MKTTPRTLVVASQNAGKAAEIRSMLAAVEGWSAEPLPADTPDIEETGATFLENAIRKAQFYGDRLGGWTVADDSGLEVAALSGRPGVRSARYAPTDEERNRKLLGELAGVPTDRRDAEFVCALALACDGKIVWQVEERVSGRIAAAPAGTNGFGYDPVFFLPELGKTMGELSPEVKNRISHRGRALDRLLGHLRQLG
jgi:XTP/dITP diphosphohydrolase